MFEWAEVLRMVDLIDRNAVVDIVMCYCTDDDGSCSKADVDIRELLDDIENLPTVNRWIPCSEQMMPDGERVLMRLTNGEVFVMKRNKNSASDGLRHLTDLSSVECWMSIPDSYEPTESEVG